MFTKKIVFALLLNVGLLQTLQVLYAQKVSEVGPVCITVDKLETSLPFYTNVLQFEHKGTEEFMGEAHENLLGKFGIRYKVAHLQLGDERVDLIDYLTAGGRSIPEAGHSNDLSFQHIAIVVSDMEKAFERLNAHGVEYISTAPQTIPLSNPAAAGIKAFYFLDVDGHSLELIYFPAGKGNPKWQQSKGKLFLGVDHTAIGIENTGSGLVFWRDLLGLEKKGESHNLGTEQAHLNNVHNAELRITGLGAAKGPGVEFLQYLQPGPGKPYPSDTQCDDLWNWMIVVRCTQIDKLYENLKNSGYIRLSSEPVSVAAKKNFIARDPDGHAVWFIED